MAVSKADRCPECGYDLRGLPPAHRCPECGFQYDEHTLIWRPAKPWKLYSIYALPISYAVFRGITKVLYPLLMGRGVPSFEIESVVFVLVVGGVAVFWVHSANRRGRFAAITETGIFVRARTETEFIAWRDVTDVVPGPRIVKIRRASRRIPVEVAYVFDGATDAANFRDEVRLAKQRYADARATAAAASVPARPQSASPEGG